MAEQPPVLTLVQFRRTRAYCADLCKHPTIGPTMYDVAAPVPGYVYLDALYIEINCGNESENTPPELRGAFHLVLANSEWLVDDLAALEQHLYDYALGEGYCASPVRDPGRFFDLPDEVALASLNAALMAVQAHLGVTDGGIAARFFGAHDDPQNDFFALMRDYAAHEALYSVDDEHTATLGLLDQLAKFAVPTSEDDWGSLRQITAQNFFFQMVEAFGIDTSRWETAKATVDEMVAEAMHECCKLETYRKANV